MSPKTKQEELDELLKERLLQLPKVVQEAVASGNLEQHLRELADLHKLHLDQWQTLQNEVMLALLGFQPSEDLEKNLKEHIDISLETASGLAADISKIVFEPIREELERSLDNPHAKEGQMTDVEKAGQQILAQEKAATVVPSTPPQAPLGGTVVRAPVSESYKAGEPSAVRKSVVDDPYREPPA